MPIYEFKCEKCSQRFEKLLLKKIEDNPLCPTCGSNKVKKMISISHFRIKGYNETNGYSNGGVK